MKSISLHEPKFNELDEQFLLDALRSTWVSTSGKYVDKFEKDFADFTGSRHAISVCNGTIALQLSLEVLKRQRNFENLFEVIVPSLTFVATINAVFHSGGIPVLVDCGSHSMNIDPDLVLSTIKNFYEYDKVKATWINKKTYRPLLAVMPAHIMGWSCNMNKLSSICSDLEIPIIEDAAEALGSYELNGRHLGNHGLAASFSFNGNKILTTGGGGMITTNDTQFAKRAKHLSTTAKTDGLNFVHDEVGYNFRMVNLLAALGCSQLPNLPDKLRLKKGIFERYQAILEPAGVSIHVELENIPNNWIVNALFKSKASRDTALANLIKNNIQCRPLWTPAHRLPFVQPYLYSDQTFANSEKFWELTLSLPSSPHLAPEDLDATCISIINSVKEF